MNFFRIKKYDEFQHYKDRNPPWIKLHRTIFTDYEFSCLQDASKLQLILIWMLASQLENKIPYDPDWVKSQIGVKGKVDLKVLENKGFIFVDSDSLAECKQSADGETEAYKQETEAYKQETETEEHLCRDIEKRVLDDLNQKSVKKFKQTETNLKIISARLAEGYTEEDLLQVNSNQCREWMGDPKMEKYIRPETIYAKSKISGYVNNREVAPKKEQTTFEKKRERVMAWAESEEKPVFEITNKTPKLLEN